MAAPRNVLIVGASASLGGGLVRRFRQAGDRVLATYHATAPAASADDPDLRHAALDITDAASRSAFAAEHVAAFGPLDVAVLLPGLLPGKRLQDYDAALAQRVVDVTFTGQALLIQALLPHFANGSQLLLLASISGQRGSYDPLYAGAKGAVLALVKALATALAPRSRVNAVAPALVEGSRMYDDMAPDVRDGHRQRTPSGELLRADDLAAVLYDLTQPHWRALNGACIDLNGGQYLR